ncbi:restriction endonuclease subunit S [Enterococcus casseliflavus]|uniref:restriction endonuclease subunit S n=1 Tax=Enterococcus casseliflavus TaxID=37734 RepID=UPI0039A73CAC
MREKNAPKLRFKGFFEDWEQRKVFEISKVTYGGGTPKTNTKEFWNGNIPWIQSSDLEINRLFNVSPKKKITNEAVKKSAAKIIPPNSIAIVTRVGVGKLALMPFEYATSQDFLSLSELQIDSYFGIFSLYSMLQKELKNIQGTSIKGMTKSDLLEKKVTIPKKYEEQQKIGNFFKQLDDTIALHQRKIDSLKLLKHAFLQKMLVNQGFVPEVRFADFDEKWEQRKLGDLGTVAMNKRIFKKETSERGDIPFYKIGTFGSAPDSFISRRLFDEYKEKYPYPEKGDLLISASGSIGRVVEYTGADEYFQDSNIVWLKHDNQLVNSFLKQFYNIVKWHGLEGSTIKRLYNKNILETEIGLPSRDEQQKIGYFFKQLDDTIALHQIKLDNFKQLKKSFSQKIFI